MESSPQFASPSRSRVAQLRLYLGVFLATPAAMARRKVWTGAGATALLAAAILSLSATPLAADTYRWKDKNGEIHYGAAVPAEYADQPYDILNNSGMVIEHVEDTTIPLEAIAEKKAAEKERAPLISEEERQIQSDRLLVIRYSSEEEILKALELEIAQLGYDNKVINQSFESTAVAIRSQISQAADQQRAGQQVSAEQEKEIKQLYARHNQDAKKKAAMSDREEKIRARYQAELERYRYLTSDSEEDQDPTDQG
ncbi:MAG TPA: DUF4124 domain-containing protein [Xanthomonadales bacterium]